jgi:hypothetical protein
LCGLRSDLVLSDLVLFQTTAFLLTCKTTIILSLCHKNLIDPAHIPISHDQTPGGGKRENAQAYNMEVDQDSFGPKGFTGRYKNAKPKTNKTEPWIETVFEAPGIVRYRSDQGKILFGAALHCMPLGMGRSRLLFRTYFTGLPWYFKIILSLKPLWLRNLNSCKILEQDMGLITSQEDHFARNRDRQLVDDFLLLSSSDKFVSAYRKWMDRVGHGMPWFQGLVSASTTTNTTMSPNSHLERAPIISPGLFAGHRGSGQDIGETRYHRHVIQSPETRTALARIQKLKQVVLVLAVAAVTSACGLASTVALSTVAGGDASAASGSFQLGRKILLRAIPVLIPVLSLSAAALHRLEQRFYFCFRRKDQLRKEKGF